MGAIGFDPAQIEELAAAVNTVNSCVKTACDDIEALFKNLTGDAVFGECVYKETLLDVKNKVNAILSDVANILDNSAKRVEAVGQKAGVSISKNIMSIEDQNAAITAAKNQLG